MIRVVYTIPEDEEAANAFVPKYVCDTCNEIIEHLSQGVLVFIPPRNDDVPPYPEGLTLEAKVVHKGKCDLTYGEHPDKRGWWYELDQVAEFMRVDNEKSAEEEEAFTLGGAGLATRVEPDISKFDDAEKRIILPVEAQYSGQTLKLIEHYIIRSYVDYPDSDNVAPLTPRYLRVLRAVWTELLADIPADLLDPLYELAKRRVAEEAADPDREMKWRDEALKEAMFYAERGQPANVAYNWTMGAFRKRPLVTGQSMRVTWNLNKERLLQGDLD